MNDDAINWEALRMVLKGDVQIYARLSAAADHSAAGNATRDRYAALIEQAHKTLRSMDAIEAGAGTPVQVQPSRPCRKHGDPECFCDYEIPVPGLAEHTAAAQDKIIEASRPVPFADHDHSGPGGCPVCVGMITATAAACDTITKAAQ